MPDQPQLTDTGATRIVVVPADRSQAQEFWADSWSISVQDDGQTLKLIARGDGETAKKKRSESFAEWLGGFFGAVSG